MDVSELADRYVVVPDLRGPKIRLNLAWTLGLFISLALSTIGLAVFLGITAAVAALQTSTAWTLLAYSWPMRWNTRSAPVRSTRTSMPLNFSLKAPAIFSATERSTAVYQTTLPSFFAASINCGVIASAGGASARAGAANTAPSASAVEPFRMSRLDGVLF